MCTGYIQTPQWDGHRQYGLMTGCVTLTKAAKYVVFVTVLSLRIAGRFTGHSAIEQKVVISPGPCWTNQDKGKEYAREDSYGPLVFPNDFQEYVHPSNDLSFSIIGCEGLPHYGFRMRYSFHHEDYVPHRVEGGWNCSLAVWPDLHHHFPCDLRPQCADAEDEVKCFYTSKKCGTGKVIYLFLLVDTKCCSISRLNLIARGEKKQK